MEACAFTGHRPEKLPYSSEQHPGCLRLKAQLYDACTDMLTRGVRMFICGMSRGVDIWAAECVLRLRKERPDDGIMLWAVVPYSRQAESWSADDQARYRHILAAADRVNQITDAYFRGCLHRRNRFMVDHAQCLIAVCNGHPGGTQSTIQYAQEKGLEIILIQP